MKLLNFAALFLLTAINLLSQNQGITTISDRNPSGSNTVKLYSITYASGGSSSGYILDDFCISGKNDYSVYNSKYKNYDTYLNEWRSYFSFSLSIPSNAILKNIELSVTAGYNGSIVAAPIDIGSYSNDNFFETIGNGGVLINYPVLGWRDITNYASQFLSNGSFCVGVRSSDNYHNVTLLCRVIYDVPINISFQNNMGGQFSVNGDNKNEYFNNDYWLNSSISLSLNEPQYTSSPNYTWIWNDTEAPINSSTWDKIKNGTTVNYWNDQSIGFSVTSDDQGALYKANMKKICNVTFQNSFGGGIINVNYSQVSAPSSGNGVIEGNTIYASAINQTLNGISYVFDKWHEDNNGFISRTFNITDHITWTADFIGRPTNNGEYIHFGTTAGQPIVIYWTDNPNSNVTSYQIWRKVKHNGVMGSAVNIATVSSGVGSYTDYEYLLTSSYSNDLLYYDVRAYYSTEGTYSTEDYAAVYGEMNLMTFKETNMQASLFSEVPADYNIENYPNPFNPTTKITYQLPEKSNVVLKIYDALGKEIRTLVNSTKEAGYYSIDFDASDLPSGVYVYQIQAGRFNQSKKMLLVK